MSLLFIKNGKMRRTINILRILPDGFSFVAHKYKFSTCKCIITFFSDLSRFFYVRCKI